MKNRRLGHPLLLVTAFYVCAYSEALFGAPAEGFTIPRVLYIGDSLSIGPFGERLQDSLTNSYGRARVWFYASCGSTVEKWLSSEPIFITPCGYRESTPSTSVLEDFHEGKRPRKVPTPKIEDLIKTCRPEIVIVQLGTNHYDSLEKGGDASIPKQEGFFELFADALQAKESSVRRVIWILPPDSARYSDHVQTTIQRLIRRMATRHEFDIIDSRSHTHYTIGKTGEDGVHYSKKPALEWAAWVIDNLNRIFRTQR